MFKWCCPERTEDDTFVDNDGMISSKAKKEFEEILRERNANTVPLISGLNTTFKSAADIDSSSSPIEKALLDEMLATTSSDDDDDDEEGMFIEESEDESE